MNTVLDVDPNHLGATNIAQVNLCTSNSGWSGLHKYILAIVSKLQRNMGDSYVDGDAVLHEIDL